MFARTRASVPVVLTTIAICGAALVGCQSNAPGAAKEAPSATPTAVATPAVSESAAPVPIESEQGAPVGFAVPDHCEDAYSATMLTTLGTESPPLNDPGLTLLATQSFAGLDLLDSGIPTLRCSWGEAGERGLATNISAVTDAESARVMASLQESGFTCVAHGEGTLCTFSEKTVTRDDVVVELGESDYFGEGGWVATSWVDYLPAGYTEDVAATVWN